MPLCEQSEKGGSAKRTQPCLLGASRLGAWREMKGCDPIPARRGGWQAEMGRDGTLRPEKCDDTAFWGVSDWRNHTRIKAGPAWPRAVARAGTMMTGKPDGWDCDPGVPLQLPDLETQHWQCWRIFDLGCLLRLITHKRVAPRAVGLGGLLLTSRLQEAILASPMGVVRLMDMMMEREVIRNQALLLLVALTRANDQVQKIAAFEGAFERLFNIIRWGCRLPHPPFFATLSGTKGLKCLGCGEQEGGMCFMT